MCRDRAAVHVDHSLDERQANAQTAMRTLERAIDLREHVEDAIEHLSRNADPVIDDADHYAAGVPFDDEPYLAARLGIYLAALLSKLEMTWASRVAIGLEQQRLRSAIPPAVDGPALR